MIRLDTTSEQSILNMLREHNALNGQQIKQIESLSKESGKSQIETAFELNITNDTKVAELLSESFSIPLIVKGSFSILFPFCVWRHRH